MPLHWEVACPAWYRGLSQARQPQPRVQRAHEPPDGISYSAISILPANNNEAGGCRHETFAYRRIVRRIRYMVFDVAPDAGL